MPDAFVPVPDASLAGQVAVVTGGAGGIGRAFAESAAAEGIRVCCWDLTGPPPASGYEAEIKVDVVSEKSVEAAIERTMEEFGRLDILVNSAGITGPVMETAEYAFADWQRVLAINLTGTFLCSRAAIRVMKQRDYGRIVNVASIAGKEGNPYQAAYTASKAGVIGLTKTIGKELASTGIRVNCITPGITATDLVLQMTEAQRQLVLAKIPMGRPAAPAEIASLMLWMASPVCSFTTGAVFDISGGRAGH